MSSSISEVARMAGVTARTLRHYDSIGLVHPARVDDMGQRWYDEEQLRRLQHVLLLRRLGLGLAAIASVLDGTTQELELLRHHHTWLLAERARLDRLAAIVATGITAREEGSSMSSMDFEDLGGPGQADRQQRYEDELVARYGEQARTTIVDSRKRWEAMSPDERRAAQDEINSLHRAFSALAADGLAPDDPRVLAVTAEHYRWVCRSWTPDAEAYRGLGQLYVDAPDFAAVYDAVRPGLASYVRDATAAYAEARL